MTGKFDRRRELYITTSTPLSFSIKRKKKGGGRRKRRPKMEKTLEKASLPPHEPQMRPRSPHFSRFILK